MSDQVLILNFDKEPDGATSYVEEVGGTTFTQTYAGFKVSRNWSKIGVGSLYAATATNWIQWAFPAVGNTDLTLHYWANIAAMPSGGSPNFLVSMSGSNAAMELYFYSDGNTYLWLGYTDGSYSDDLLEFSFEAGNEYHIGFVARELDWSVFVDGTEIATGLNPVAYAFSDITTVSAHVRASSYTYFDAIELTKEAKWTTNFTPPTSAPVYEGIPYVPLFLTVYDPTHTIVKIDNTVALSLTVYDPYRHALVPAVNLSLTVYDPTWSHVRAYVPAASLSLTARNPSAVWAYETSLLLTAKTIFRCYLTGADDGLSDLELPMKSFQARMRNGEPSYLSCVVPDSSSYETDISLRPNGDIVVKKGYQLADGTEQLEAIATVNFESIQVARGARNDTCTVIGHKTLTATSAKEREVEGVSYYGLQADGKRNIRASLDLFLRPGDTCIYGTGANDSFVVGSIAYFVTAKPFSMRMEVTEGDIA